MVVGRDPGTARTLYVPRMGTLRGYVIAAHAAPTAVVTLIMTVFAWSIGWRGAPLVLVLLAVLVGQLSVGWSNDAFDADLDRAAGRQREADGVGRRRGEPPVAWPRGSPSPSRHS